MSTKEKLFQLVINLNYLKIKKAEKVTAAMEYEIYRQNIAFMSRLGL